MYRVIATETPNVSVPNTTTETTLATIVLPGNTMSKKGHLRIDLVMNCAGGSGNKTTRVKFGSSTVQSITSTTSLNQHSLVVIRNANSKAAQIVQGSATQGYNNSASSVQSLTADTALPVTILITGQKATGTDTLTLAAYSITLVEVEDEDLPFGSGKAGATLNSQPTYNEYTFVDGKTVRKDWK